MEVITESYEHPITGREGIKAYVLNTELRAYSFNEATTRLDKEVALAKLATKIQAVLQTQSVSQVA